MELKKHACPDGGTAPAPAERPDVPDDTLGREQPARRLFIKRERALACFALPYHCVIGQGKEEHLRRTEDMDRDELMLSRENAVRNGGTICLPLNGEASSLFAAAYQEHGALTTEELPIPAGSDDLYFVIRTRFDGNRRLFLELAPSEPF